MPPIIRLLQAIRNLTKSGSIKTIQDAYRIAKREIGERFDEYKKNIDDAFNQGKKELDDATRKKEKPSNVIPFPKKKESGIKSLDTGELSDDDPLGDLQKIIGPSAKTGKEKLRDELLKLDDTMDFFKKEIDKTGKFQGLESTENIKKGIEQLKNPRRAGGPLDPVEGLTRTLARRILDKRGIDIGKSDPIDVFDETFGEIIVDVKNLAEEMLEAEQMGRSLKSMDELLELEGLFSLDIPKNPRRGVPVEDTIKRLEKDLREKEILESFDPTDREPNAAGGIAGILKL